MMKNINANSERFRTDLNGFIEAKCYAKKDPQFSIDAEVVWRSANGAIDKLVTLLESKHGLELLEFEIEDLRLEFICYILTKSQYMKLPESCIHDRGEFLETVATYIAEEGYGDGGTMHPRVSSALLKTDGLTAAYSHRNKGEFPTIEKFRNEHGDDLIDPILKAMVKTAEDAARRFKLE